MHAIILMTFTTQNNFAIYNSQRDKHQSLSDFKVSKKQQKKTGQFTSTRVRFSGSFRLVFDSHSSCHTSRQENRNISSHKFYDATTIWKLHLIHIMLNPSRAKRTMLAVTLSISHSTAE